MGPYPKPGQPWAISTRACLTTGWQRPRCPPIPLSQGDEDIATPILLVVSSGAAKESRTSPAAHRYRYRDRHRNRKRSGGYGSIPIPRNGKGTRFDVRLDTQDATWLYERTTKY